MASTPLTLAALATSAVPDLAVHGASGVAAGPSGSFLSALLESDRGRLIVRVPRTATAEAEQSGELLGRSALTAGTRAQLPFAVPETLGLTRAGESRAVVSTFLVGEHFSVSDLADDSLLLQPIAEAISAIHRLPPSTVQQAGLASRTAAEARAASARLVERAEATRMLPSTVAARWAEVLQAAELWEFAPTVVHGSLDDTQLLVSDDQVVGVLGWSELHISDPADDFAWLAGAETGVLCAVVARYAALGDSADGERLLARAAFAHELDVARWLLHGVEQHDTGIVNDAVAMLDRLVDQLPSLSQPLLPHSVLDVAQVDDLLDDTPRVDERVHDTSASDVFDDERVFFADTDFIEPVERRTDAETDLDETGVVDELSEAGVTDEAERDTPFDPLATAPLEPFDFGELEDGPDGNSR
ncbi:MULTISPECIES: phosphotransferase [unclassified Leucobacter]|uniref:phosphotransferase n=1 Tax=unclassified Leucobacter TaxID=2621730 RepID=UPI00165E467E|nr:MULTISPECIES: phosphotransferase [unclassified Leucobacter]MBC9935536.1 phosphotransferase [Leucobacter sp. cx-87]